MRFISAIVILMLTNAASAGTTVIKKKTVRKPASNEAQTVLSRDGIPRLPDGSPDYSKYPNPFVVKKWTFELEGAGGMGGGSQYGLGANAYFYRWLAWRNIAFYREGQQSTNTLPSYGIDTSERMSYEFMHGLAVFASPGYRLAGGGAAAPFAEGGILIRAGHFNIGAGARSLLHSWVETAAANETQFFVNISMGSRP